MTELCMYIVYMHVLRDLDKMTELCKRVCIEGSRQDDRAMITVAPAPTQLSLFNTYRNTNTCWITEQPNWGKEPVQRKETPCKRGTVSCMNGS